MKLLRGSWDILEQHNGTVATIGNFDGVHLGHQALLKTLRLRAEELGLPLLVMLFEPQPGEYFQRKTPTRLSSLREKLEQLRELGVDYVACVRFNAEWATMTAEAFAADVIFSQLRAKYVLIGDDFRFGYERSGDVTLLRRIAQERQADVAVFSDVFLNQKRISSTGIRHALQVGDLATAAQSLGRHYRLCGRVVYGDGRGRQWGFPTANVSLSHHPILPLRGVFCVQVARAGKAPLYGVANVGCRPTVDGSRYVLEVHVLNANESLYGERLNVYFLHKLRDEMAFSSVDALIAQIRQDAVAAADWFHLSCPVGV